LETRKIFPAENPEPHTIEAREPGICGYPEIALAVLHDRIDRVGRQTLFRLPNCGHVLGRVGLCVEGSDEHRKQARCKTGRDPDLPDRISHSSRTHTPPPTTAKAALGFRKSDFIPLPDRSEA
jgi:hypothetical protein